MERSFCASAPNELWLTDITEHPTREGNVYCCVVLDLFSRKVVGWAVDRRCESTLVNDALSMAAGTRTTSEATVIHSDHGQSVDVLGLHRERPSPRAHGPDGLGG